MTGEKEVEKKQDENLDLSEENKGDREEGDSPKGEKSPVKRVITIAAIVLVSWILIVGTTMLTLWAYQKYISPPAEKVASEDGEEAASEDEEIDALTEEEDAKEEAAEEEPIEPAKYYEIKPVFIVNLQSSDGQIHYLQTSVTVMARSQKVIDSVENAGPQIRDALLSLFNSMEYHQLLTPKGKDDLRKKSLEVISSIMEGITTEDNVEAVYFTKFIVQ